MGDERVPEFADHWRVFDGVIAYARELIGSDGTYELGYVENGQIGVFDIEPTNPRARPINVIAEQFFTVTIGHIGGRWELSYSEEDVILARRIVAATVAGRVEERRAFGRSRVAVTLDDGKVLHETGYAGCASLLVPQPGWTRWGDITAYEPYHSHRRPRDPSNLAP